MSQLAVASSKLLLSPHKERAKRVGLTGWAVLQPLQVIKALLDEKWKIVDSD